MDATECTVNLRTFFLFQKFDMKFYLPSDEDFIYDINKNSEFCLNLKENVPFPVLQRFIELLPTDSLRRFTYTSKKNYVNGLKYRGLPCRIFSNADESYPDKVDLRNSGKLLVSSTSEFPSHPIFNFLKFDVLWVLQDQREEKNIPRIYSTVIFFNGYIGRLNEYLHPNVKNVSVDSRDLSSTKEYHKFFRLIKKSNVTNVLIDIIREGKPEVAEVIELMKKIKKKNFNGYLAIEFSVTMTKSYEKRYLRWYKGDFYLEDEICNDMKEYAARFCEDFDVLRTM